MFGSDAMSEKRRKGLWFRITDEERKHVQELMAEIDNWQPRMPPPEHSIEEHLEAALLEMKDIKAQSQRVLLLFLLWILACLGLLVFGPIQWLA
jgi:hypothetical protein